MVIKEYVETMRAVGVANKAIAMVAAVENCVGKRSHEALLVQMSHMHH